jgi:2-haloalkanoic acid dehalogenase type II
VRDLDGAILALMPDSRWPAAVLFDLLTALLDSWTVWNAAAGSEARGRAWRAEYLRLTYGCGSYVPYEQLVREAVAATGFDPSAADRLEASWSQLPPWDGAREAVALAKRHAKVGVVTNCSIRLGRQAAGLLGVEWDVVVTAEEAGCYKPQPRPYEMALERLQVRPQDTAFVAGSGFDLFGTARVGLRTYWHNRVGLARPQGAPEAELVSPTLDALPDWLESFRREAA